MISNIETEVHGNTKYRPSFPESLIAWMERGHSYMTWGVDPLGDGSLRISRTQMYAWEKTYPEWKEAKIKGYQAGLKYFERLLINAANGVLPDDLKDLNSKGISLSAVIFTLKTRFHKEFSEKQVVEHTATPGSSVTVNFVKPDDVKQLTGKK